MSWPVVTRTSRSTPAVAVAFEIETAMSDQEFTDLLARARAGDNVAMQRLMAEYEPQVMTLARRRLSSVLRTVCDSMDLVQSVHRTLLLHLRQNRFEFHRSKDLVALAVDMVKKKVSKKWAKMQREKEILALMADLLAHTDSDRAAESAKELQELLETLDDDDRRFLELYLKGWKTVDIAKGMGKSPASVSVRRGRLLRGLRKVGIDLDSAVPVAAGIK
jgi:RNA polymerase sigma-70 factor (ECF subfamily)